MEFEDNPAKAVKNLKKYKVRFDWAGSVFGDPMAYTFLVLIKHASQKMPKEKPIRQAIVFE